MALPTFKKESDIPDAFKDEYEEKDGEWHPKAQGSKEDVDGLKSALETERSGRKEAEKKQKEADAALAVAEAARKEAETKADAKKAGITDDALEELRKKAQADAEAKTAADMATLKEQIKDKDETDKTIRELRLDAVVKKAMLEAGVRGERVDALFKLKAASFDLTEDDKPMLVDHPGKVVDQFIKDDLKKEFPEFFKGTQGDGGGQGGHQGGDGTITGGTTAEDVMKNPSAAIDAARAAGSTT